MLNPDPRGYRVAVVADAVANGADPSDVAIVDLLAEFDYGLVVPPPDDFEVTTIERIVEYLADDLLDYRGSGYHVVFVTRGDRPGGGVWLDRFEAEWTRRGVEALPVLDVAALDAPALRAALEVIPPAVAAGE